jgi:hypothetical protein
VLPAAAASESDENCTISDDSLVCRCRWDGGDSHRPAASSSNAARNERFKSARQPHRETLPCNQHNMCSQRTCCAHHKQILSAQTVQIHALTRETQTAPLCAWIKLDTASHVRLFLKDGIASAHTVPFGPTRNALAQ